MGNQPSRGGFGYSNHGGSQELRERRYSSRRGRRGMDRLRRSLRESLRRGRKEHVPECSKPHQWQADEAAVRAGTCTFSVKYLGCVEVFESRGMQVCEEALKVLRNSRRRSVRGTLHVTGDGLRVVDDGTQGLLVDQTIEKVSFCAPDRNHDRGFSYICRDGTTRRWMCHGFLAVRDSGERLSHAVGCAFAVCLERKQKRDKESVMMNFDPKTSTFTRTGSFRQTSLTEGLQDPQECKPSEPPPVKPIVNPFAIERPHATASMLQRQGSFRGFGGSLSQTSPFKRQLSLRLNDLPSTLERQRAMSLESAETLKHSNGFSVHPIPESSPSSEKADSISAMCQQLSQGLTMLSSTGSTEDPFQTPPPTAQLPPLPQPPPVQQVNPWVATDSSSSRADAWLASLPTSPKLHDPSHPVAPSPQPRRNSPNFGPLRSQSVGSSDALPAAQRTTLLEWAQQKSAANAASSATAPVAPAGVGNAASRPVPGYRDPFDADWAAIPVQKSNTTNPFVGPTSVKAFEVRM